tara:strand:+ start:1818 stop:2132 length:315 start_codon:yes stop_codon:yes gene_type:complete
MTDKYTTPKTVIHKGIPQHILGHPSHTQGPYAKGKEAAMGLVKMGPGHSSVTELSGRSRVAGFKSGAKSVSKRFGNNLKVVQRKIKGDVVHVIIMFHSDFLISE